MLLLSDAIGFPDHSPEIGGKSCRVRDPEMMHVVAGGKGFDAMKTRKRVTLREYEVSDEGSFLQNEGGEGHADVEGDASLFRQDLEGPAPPRFCDEVIKQLPDRRSAPLEVRLEGLQPAGSMRLVPAREGASALCATPERAALLRHLAGSIRVHNLPSALRHSLPITTRFGASASSTMSRFNANA